MHRML